MNILKCCDESFISVVACGTLRVDVRAHAVSGGKLGRSVGKLPEFPEAVLLGVCVLAHGDDVHRGLRRRVR